MTRNINKLLDSAAKAYYDGKPFMSDDLFDYLAENYKYDKVGARPTDNIVKHRYKVYSLMKVVDAEKRPFVGGVKTPKLDGAAVVLLYSDGNLIQGAIRGDGEYGEDITDKCYMVPTIPTTINIEGEVQITGELLAFKEIKNARNFTSGATRLKDLKEFKQRVQSLVFVAYDIQPYLTEEYACALENLSEAGFKTVLDENLKDMFPIDGLVYRINNNQEYIEAGHTARHPKGAYAFKETSDVEVKETVLRDVIWQVGKSGKVTPVAIFDEVVIEDAKITRATLHNVGFIEEMELMIGDIILVTRAGKIIPKVIGKK